MDQEKSSACSLPFQDELSAEHHALYQSENIITKVLSASRTIAIVGLSDNSNKPSYHVADYLQGAGYRIVPINPRLSELFGEKAYPDLLSVPFPIDIVDVFHHPRDIPEITGQAIKIKARCLWMQLRLIDLDSAGLAHQAGLDVVVDRCALIEHQRLFARS